jgi:hypothetical protein
MNSDQENFECLRQLLALKRHEQPPPGYLEDFSNQVILRLRAGETGEPASVMARLLRETPWLQRLWTMLEARPVFAGAFGATLCALLLSGIIYAEKAEPTSFAPNLAANVQVSPFATPASLVANLAPSTNPISPSASLFNEIQLQLNQQPEKVNLYYTVPGGN